MYSNVNMSNLIETGMDTRVLIIEPSQSNHKATNKKNILKYC